MKIEDIIQQERKSLEACGIEVFSKEDVEVLLLRIGDGVEQTLKNDTEILDWIDSFHGSLKVRRRIGREPFYHLCKTSCEEQTADNIRDLILKAKEEG